MPVHGSQGAEEEVAHAELGIWPQALDALLGSAHDHHLLQPLGHRVAKELSRPLPRRPLVLVKEGAEGERLAYVAAITTDVGAVPGEHVELVPVLVHVAVEHVPDIAVLGDDPQRPPFTRAADHKRQVLLHRFGLAASVLQLEVLALERRRLLRPEAPHDPAGLVEHVHPHADARERDAVLVVLQLEPGGAHPELQPATEYVVDRGGHLRHHGRMSVGHTKHQHPAPNPARVRRHRG